MFGNEREEEEKFRFIARLIYYCLRALLALVLLGLAALAAYWWRRHKS